MTHPDNLPPEEQAGAWEKLGAERSIKPTQAQIDLALKVFTDVKDYAKVSTLISAASRTLEDALKRG